MQAAKEIETSLEMYADPIVGAYIDSLGQTLVKAHLLSMCKVLKHTSAGFFKNCFSILKSFSFPAVLLDLHLT